MHNYKNGSNDCKYCVHTRACIHIHIYIYIWKSCIHTHQNQSLSFRQFPDLPLVHGIYLWNKKLHCQIELLHGFHCPLSPYIKKVLHSLKILWLHYWKPINNESYINKIPSRRCWWINWCTWTPNASNNHLKWFKCKKSNIHNMELFHSRFFKSIKIRA
jgi:hypothetical protein